MLAEKRLDFSLSETEKQLSYGRVRFKDPRLRVRLGNLDFDNPFMAGAGSDKRAVQSFALYKWGLSGVEIGTVTEFPQEANKNGGPFEIAPGVSFNSVGFENPGMDKVAANAEKYQNRNFVLGGSLGINRGFVPEETPASFARVAQRLLRLVDYLVVNASSPNTPGLKDLLSRAYLTPILQDIKLTMGLERIQTPLLVKIPPEFSFYQIDEVLDVALENSVSGVIVANSINTKEILEKYGKSLSKRPGGLAGADDDYRSIVRGKIAYVRKEAGKKLWIFASGGIDSARVAWDYSLAGANMFQMVTSLRTPGVKTVDPIKREFLEMMKKAGARSQAELIGQSA